jgi:hypothetical protein
MCGFSIVADDVAVCDEAVREMGKLVGTEGIGDNMNGVVASGVCCRVVCGVDTNAGSDLSKDSSGSNSKACA